jgi:CubicO group peptidase (beta-lactamase class C family)
MIASFNALFWTLAEGRLMLPIFLALGASAFNSAGITLNGPAEFDPAVLRARLEAIAEAKSSQYDCRISIAIEAGSGLSLSAGSPGDFVWGSVTKLATGAALMQLVAAGKVTLDEPIFPHIDPGLAALGLGSMAFLFGAEARLVSLRHLLGMRSGIPDYDTAKPYPPPPTDPFRADVYAHLDAPFTPVTLINLSYVRRGQLDFHPGLNFSYSSTNFVLAGLALAVLTGSPTWDAYDQASLLSPLPPGRRAQYADLRFSDGRSPAAEGAVTGYDRTDYNGANASARPGFDVSAVPGVFGGWTASNLVGSPAVVARLAYDIFGSKGPRVLPTAQVAEMVPREPPAGRGHSGSFYGLATFNLTIMGVTGQSALSPFARAYGHLGATYGYDSIVSYFPGIDAAIAVASNIETDSQDQPSDAMCFAYNAVLAAMRGVPEPPCTFGKRSFYGSSCQCGNDFICRQGMCVRDTLHGSLSKEDCASVCR